MKLKRDEALKKSKRPAGSIVLYVAAIAVIIIGAAYLVTNIVLFQNMVTQYVAQGHTVAEVTNQLLLSQLLPGIYEPIAVYGGITLLLFGAGMINHKISKCLNMVENLGVEGPELDADKIDDVTPDVGGVEPNGLKSEELGSSEFETDKVEVTVIETDESRTDLFCKGVMGGIKSPLFSTPPIVKLSQIPISNVMVLVGNEDNVAVPQSRVTK